VQPLLVQIGTCANTSYVYCAAPCVQVKPCPRRQTPRVFPKSPNLVHGKYLRFSPNRYYIPVVIFRILCVFEQENGMNFCDCPTFKSVYRHPPQTKRKKKPKTRWLPVVRSEVPESRTTAVQIVIVGNTAPPTLRPYTIPFGINQVPRHDTLLGFGFTV
jgi:hypothetical protein